MSDLPKGINLGAEKYDILIFRVFKSFPTKLAMISRWLSDERLEESNNLPDPDVVAPGEPGKS